MHYKQNVMILLKSLAVNFPIIRELGLGPKKLLWLVVENSQMKMAIDALVDSDEVVLHEECTSKIVKNLLIHSNSTYLIYPYFPSRKGRELIQLLVSYVRVENIQGERLSALPLIISDGIPEDVNLENFFIIYIDGKFEYERFGLELIVPSDELVPVVVDKIRNCINQEKTSAHAALIAAACFTYPYCLNEKQQDVFDNLLECVDELVFADDENKEPLAIEKLFLEALYRWQAETKFSDAYLLSDMDEEKYHKRTKFIWFDEDYVYIYPEMFSQLCKILLRIFSVPVIKKTLAKTGVLLSESSSNYTTKMGFYNSEGKYERERVFRFSRNRLKITSELGFIENCVSERREI